MLEVLFYFWLTFWLALFSLKSTSASSGLTERQFDGGDSPADTLKTLETWIDGALKAGDPNTSDTLNEANDLLAPPRSTPSTPTEPVNPFSDHDTYHLSIHNPAPKPSEPIKTPTPSLLSNDCQPGDNDSSDDCQVRLAYIIRPLNNGPNQGIRDALTSMRLRKPFRISQNPKHGMFFCLADLTKEQAERIESREDVAFIVQDSIIPNDEMALDELDAESPEKRDTIQIQQNAVPDLAFLSTAPLQRPTNKYYYSSSAGEGTTVYSIDLGLEPSNSEFTTGGVIRKWIFTLDSNPVESDDDPDGHGSCVASKIVGNRFGAAKKASLVVVKHIRTASSMIDAYVAVLYDLEVRVDAKEQVRGRVVLCSTIGWGPKIQNNEARVAHYDALIIPILEMMINEYQVVIVAASGNYGRTLPLIDNTPQKLSTSLPIITVGMVGPKGQTIRDSQRGPALTVSAAGNVMCAKARSGDASRRGRGTSFAAPLVAGFVAELLSRPKGDELRQATGAAFPHAVRDYVVSLAYPRITGGDLVAWNGLYPPTTRS